MKYRCTLSVSSRKRVLSKVFLIVILYSVVLYYVIIARIKNNKDIDKDEENEERHLEQESNSHLFLRYESNSHVFKKKEKGDKSPAGRLHPKTILIWNAPERREIYAFGFAKDSFSKQGCQYTQCQMALRENSSVTRPLDDYDAILVNINDEFLLRDPLPIRARQDQKLIFFTQEPPPSLAMFYNISEYDGYFNWTMTYRTDSDIPFLYGRIVQRGMKTHPLQGSNKKKLIDVIIRNKTRSVAWMVNNCNSHSHREVYIRELAKYIDVDIYGICGDLRCPRDPFHVSHPKCYDMIEAKYKFYLSFENSLCRDYVTEKLYKVLDHYVVPVVYGGVDYSQVAPPHSYIDARKFASPKQLADYLKILNENERLYREYFQWKEDFIVEAGLEHQVRHGFCDLCRKLHEDTSPKSHLNLSADWAVDSQCVNPIL